MIGRLIRVVFGFVLACLAAGLTTVLFVYAPFEQSDLAVERLTEVGILSLVAATQSALFAAPFALIGVVFGEWQRIGSWMYYVLVTVAVAAIGFLTQFWSGTGGVEATFSNRYAGTAFLVTGVVAGIVYWLVSGRFARRPRLQPRPDVLD
jgi:hypothetical protein